MAFSHGTAARIWLDGFGASCSLNEVSIETEIDTAETTTLCRTAKTYIPGLEDGTIEMSGFFESDPDAPDTTLEAWLDARKRTIFPVAFYPQGADSAGDPAYLLNGMLTSYGIETTVDDAATIELEVQTTDGILNGLVLQAQGSETVTGEGGYLDHGMSTPNGAVALLSVASVSGTNPELTVVVEHTADDPEVSPVWVPLVSFSPVDEVSSQYIQVSGPVERYVRATWVIAGTDDPEFSFNVILRRR